MASGRYDRVRRLFLDALEHPASEQPTFVHQRAAGDASLAGAVLALLREHTEQLWQAESSPFRDGATPEAIGPYRVLRELGRGGMGVVWLAQRGDEPPVAIKRAHRTLASEESRARLEREAESLAALHHPAIARFLARGSERTTTGERPWFAMEYVEGQPLRSADETRPWPLERRLELLATLADALHHAHAHGVLHRDVKPSNVIVRPNGGPCLLDFGIARRLAADGTAETDLTTLGLVLGTTPYMSPEQARDDRGSVDARSDVYSLAVTGFEWLTDALPHEPSAPTQSAILLAIVSQAPRLLRDARRDCPRSLERVFAKALAREPERRYATAAEFARDLRCAARGELVVAPDVPLVARVRRRLRWHRGMVAVASGLATLALVAAMPRAWRWATVERRPDVVLARFQSTTDAIEPSVRHNDRTVATVDAALAKYDSLEAELAPVRGARWAVDLRRAIHWRRAELRIWRAEMTADPTDLQACISELEAVRQLGPDRRQPAALRDSTGRLGGLIAFTLQPEVGLTLLAGCHEALAQVELPRTHESAARQLGLESLRLALHQPAGLPESSLVAAAIAHPDSLEYYRMVLHGAGGPLVRLSRLTGDSAMRARGFSLLRRAARPAVENTVPPLASLRHSMGMAWLDRARDERSPAAADSAIAHFRLALEFRRASVGNLSYFETRREAIDALALLAELEPSRARRLLSEAAALLEGDIPNVRADVHPSHRAHLELALAGIRLAQWERWLAEARPADVRRLLDRAGGVFEPQRFPLPAAQVALARARLARLEGRTASAESLLAGIPALVPVGECRPLELQVRLERKRPRRTRPVDGLPK